MVTVPDSAHTLPSLSDATAYSEKQLAALTSLAPKPKAKRYRSAKSAVLKVHIQLISPTTIGITSQPHDERVVNVVKNVSGSAWDEKWSQWTCRVSAVEALKARLHSLRGDHLEVEIDAPDSRFVEEGKAEERKDQKDGKGEKEDDGAQYEWMKRIPRKLARQLYPFQRAGVDYVLQHGGRALIGDEMGLGKTLQSLAICAVYYEHWPVLIVCPSSLRLNWRNEIERWLPNVLHRQVRLQHRCRPLRQRPTAVAPLVLTIPCLVCAAPLPSCRSS